MKHNLTEEELDRYARKFYHQTGRTEDDPDDLNITEELDINLIVACATDFTYRTQFAGVKIPDNEKVVVEFEKWLKSQLRKDKIASVLPFI